MTYEEAIKRFKIIVNNEAYTDSFQDACRLAIEALEKQIPKKPNYVYDDEPLCPYCQEVIEGGDVICESCRQLIDWSDAE